MNSPGFDLWLTCIKGAALTDNRAAALWFLEQAEFYFQHTPDIPHITEVGPHGFKPRPTVKHSA